MEENCVVLISPLSSVLGLQSGRVPNSWLRLQVLSIEPLHYRLRSRNLVLFSTPCKAPEKNIVPLTPLGLLPALAVAPRSPRQGTQTGPEAGGSAPPQGWSSACAAPCRAPRVPRLWGPRVNGLKVLDFGFLGFKSEGLALKIGALYLGKWHMKFNGNQKDCLFGHGTRQKGIRVPE